MLDSIILALLREGRSLWAVVVKKGFVYDMKITLALKADQDLSKRGEEEEIHTRMRGMSWARVGYETVKSTICELVVGVQRPRVGGKGEKY